MDGFYSKKQDLLLDDNIDILLKKIDEMDEYATQYFESVKIPENIEIYKYVSFKDQNEAANQRKILTIANNKIFVNNVGKQEDENDTILGKCEGNEIIKRNFKTFQSLLRTILKSASFTTSKDLSYMWEKYANNYNGICIKYLTLKNNKLHKMTYYERLVDITGLFTIINSLSRLSPEYREKALNALNAFTNYKDKDQFEKEFEIRYSTTQELIDNGYEVPNGDIGITPLSIYIGSRVNQKDKDFLLKNVQNVAFYNYDN